MKLCYHSTPYLSKNASICEANSFVLFGFFKKMMFVFVHSVNGIERSLVICLKQSANLMILHLMCQKHKLNFLVSVT